MEKYRPQPDQQGFASLIIGIVLLIVLSLLTLGFAQLSRNELKQATNRQLNNQAYYAAESGINDAVKALKLDPSLTKTTCPPYSAPTTAAETALSNNNVSVTGTDTTVQWTCLTINPSPKTLKFGPIGVTTPKVFKTWTDDPYGISSIMISWKDNTNTVSFQRASGVSSNNAFPASGQWSSPANVTDVGATGMLRTTITPLTDTSRTGLVNNTFTSFLYPSVASGNTTPFAPGQSTSGVIVNGACTTSPPATQPYYCAVTITGINVGPNVPILFTLRSVYSPTDVQITATDSRTGTADLLGVQTEIDATGRDQDVQKRLQAMLPQTNEYDYPAFTLDSLNGVCKQLSVYPGSASGCAY